MELRITVYPSAPTYPECDGPVQPRTEESGQPGQEL